MSEYSVPLEKKFPVIRSGFPARRAQGICRKRLRQIRKTARESSGWAVISKTSLQNSLPAANRSLRLFHRGYVYAWIMNTYVTTANTGSSTAPDQAM